MLAGGSGVQSIMRGLEKRDRLSSAQFINMAYVRENSPKLNVVWVSVHIYNKDFPLYQAVQISMQEVLPQQQEVGFTDINH